MEGLTAACQKIFLDAVDRFARYGRLLPLSEACPCYLSHSAPETISQCYYAEGAFPGKFTYEYCYRQTTSTVTSTTTATTTGCKDSSAKELEAYERIRALVLIICGTALLMVAVLVGGFKIRQYKKTHAMHDFGTHFQHLADAGEIRPDQASESQIDFFFVRPMFCVGLNI